MRFLTLLFVSALIPFYSYALECPQVPEQARKDWDVQVKAAVGKIGPATGAELETLTRTVTKDLMSKLPEANKVYLEQMMFASYCSALRDDKTLSETERGTRIKAYSIELRRTLYGQPGPPAKGPRQKEGVLRPEEARIQLSEMSLSYTPQTFIQSVKNRDVFAVKLFLTAGMDPNVTDKEGITAMMYAAREGYNEIIEALLKAKADVNQQNKSGVTALSWAVAGEKVGTLRVLLDHGPNTEAINSAFVSAARNGQLEILRLLLSRGADVNKVGAQALWSAANSQFIGTIEKRLSETVEFLLALGADVNTTSDEGWTPLMAAVHNGYASVARVLVEHGADINARCDCPNIFYFMDARSDLPFRNDGGWTGLLLASFEGRQELVVFLIGRGADVNRTNKRGQTPLILAAYRGHESIIEALLKAGADVNVKDEDGRTALMWAAANNDPKSVHALVQKMANVNEKDARGITPLMLAARSGSVEVARALLQLGAQVNAKDAEGKTALDFTRENMNHDATAEMIRLLGKTSAR